MSEMDKCLSIFYERGSLKILDQKKLPETREIVEIRSVQDAWNAIKTMQVRGAPAIAIVGILSIAVKLHESSETDKQKLHSQLVKDIDYLLTSRPTAVNLRNAVVQFKQLSESLVQAESSASSYTLRIIEEAEEMFRLDVQTNKDIGTVGAKHILNNLPATTKVNVLTVCNTGTLATAGYGTALGIIRSLHALGRLDTAYFTETRPYNQGERLTAYELVTEKIPARMICDNMVSFLMKKYKIHAVIVGADRVTANGDTANKIGTYQAAIAAKFHNVPFLVACPTTTIDPHLESGDKIPIEERPSSEITTRINVDCWNPSFDVTPNDLISAIITEGDAYAPTSDSWKDLVTSLAR